MCEEKVKELKKKISLCCHPPHIKNVIPAYKMDYDELMMLIDDIFQN